MLTLLPMSVSLAAIDCMFHEEDTLEIHESTHVQHPTNSHDTLLSDLGDIELVVADAGEAASPDNGCSMKLMSAAAGYADVDATSVWAHSYDSTDGDYSLSAVLLPTEIRPPIV